MLQPGYCPSAIARNVQVKDMKRLIILGVVILPLILLPQLAAARGSKAVDIEQTERRIDGLTYEVDSDTPLSGQVRGFYSRKKKRSEVNFVDGKRDGLSTRWHENGNKQSEETYAAGELNGVVTRWWPNGEKQT